MRKEPTAYSRQPAAKPKNLLSFWVLFGASYFLLMVFCGPLYANALDISNVDLKSLSASADTVQVEFDITWDNAWRDAVNHDAVWVFGKYSTDSGSTWNHMKLKRSGTNPTGFSTGSGSSIQIKVPSDLAGCFIERTDTASGTVTTTDVQLVWDYGVDSVADETIGTTTMIKLFGIEMVYVPQGAFYLGDADSTTGSSESGHAYHRGLATTFTLAPVRITDSLIGSIFVSSSSNSFDATAIQDTNTGFGVDGDGGIDSNNDGIIDNTHFPTGYEAFYVMKYELSQTQWADFLNTLTQAQQNNRVVSDLSNENDANTYVMIGEASGSPNARQAVKAGPDPSDGEPYTFGVDLDDDNTLNGSSDGNWIAMAYLQWFDVCAFADWAGLRPITELELEKATRGPLAPILTEFAWGSASGTGPTSITNSGQVDEVPNQGNINMGSGIGGPLRVGSFAQSATDRSNSGAGYYGVLDMSGNVSEQVVQVYPTNGASIFEGTHGDGTLTTTTSYEGNATNTDWPGIDGTTARGVTGEWGSIRRFGDHGSIGNAGISYRTPGTYPIGSRTSLDSGRLGRSASTLTE